MINSLKILRNQGVHKQVDIIPKTMINSIQPTSKAAVFDYVYLQSVERILHKCKVCP